MAIVLASGSPRRRQLLTMLGVRDLLVIPAAGEEVLVPGRGPEETVAALSLAKAREVAAARPGTDVIIAADTLVWLDGEPLGKPHDAADAARMLGLLSGRTHAVYSGVTVVAGGTPHTETEKTLVRFRALTEKDISDYIATGEPMDKAGAYGAQGRGSLFVEGIEGDFFNVMGLPLCRLGKMLDGLGVDWL